MGFFDKLKEGLLKSKIIFSSNKVDENLLEELEEKLITADVGYEITEEIISELRDKIKSEKLTETEDVKNALSDILKEIFSENNTKLDMENKPAVILMIGVNGSGKTTSIGKIANNLVKSGKKVLVVAGDTFRAGAVEQLAVWADRAKCQLIKGVENQDPSSVIFEATRVAKEQNYDVVICDTAGRLQNKTHLMDELSKMNKVLDRELPGSSKEVMLVLDASTGQNGVSQLQNFNNTATITGLIVTKLDGTSKGGIIIRLAKEFKVPIKFIGVGEGIDDMQEFNSEEFIKAILD